MENVFILTHIRWFAFPENVIVFGRVDELAGIKLAAIVGREVLINVPA